MNNNKNREYEFDAVGRLKKMKGGATGNLSTQTYAYDRFGNRTSVAATGVAANNSPMPTDGIPNLAFDNSNNRITTSGFQYDSAGNQTRALAEDSVTWVKYEYDAANRIQLVKKDDGTGLQAFQYGSTNARLMDYDYISNQLKIFASVGGTILSEYTEFTGAIPTWTKSYTYLGDSQLSTITPNGTGGEAIEYDHPDRLGNRLKTNPTTGSVSEQAHLPFGTALNAETSQSLTTNNKRFTSYDRSARTGLDYAVNRTYDSKQGRFTQVDPIGMSSVSLVNPQTLNLYAYCANDPVNHTDPSGLGFFSFLKKLFKWIMVAIAVIVAVAAIATFNLPAGIGILKALTAILGLVAAVAGAASSVLGALGYTRAAKIFGLIAAITGMGSLILAKAGFSHFSETGGINWTKLGAQQGLFTGVGAIVNSFQSSKSGSSKYGKTPCDVLAKNTVFTEWAKELWKTARSTTPWHETGGLFGHEETVSGTNRTATYDRRAESRSLPEFTGWAMDTKDLYKSQHIHWEYWVHTHPVSGSTRISGLGGDRSGSHVQELPAVVIGKQGKFSIWGIDGKLVCNGSIGK